MAQKRKNKNNIVSGRYGHDMKLGRKSRRIWYGVLGAFVAAFLFGFLVTKYKDNNTADAANLGAFDAGYIISDYQMSNYDSMSEGDIQNFLKQHGNCNDTRTYLADYYTSYSYHIKDGHFVCLADETFGNGTAYGNSAPHGESAAHIIWQAAQDYRINPQVIIVLLQKEQGLITDSWPNNIQYRSATGYGCPDTAACDSQYYGFKNQVRKAAAMFRSVLDGGWTNYPLGWNYIQYNPDSGCGGSSVNIRSLATSALYRYTPYQPNASALAAGYGSGDSCGAYGNRNFYLYFEDWFGGITANQSSTKVAEGEYYIESVKDGSFVLDVANGKDNDGANIQLYGKNNTLAQQWKITYNSLTDDYNIINLGSGKSLDVYGGETKDGSNIQLWTNNGSCAQRWKILRTVNDETKILSSCSYKALDISAGKISVGQNIQLWLDNDTDAQRWKITPVNTVQEGLYHIVSSRDNNKMIDVGGGAWNANNGTNVHLWEQNYTDAQQWYISVGSDGYYMIKNLQSGKYMDVNGAKVENGANIQMWDGNNTCAQKWRILQTGNNYEFISACSMKVIDLSNASTKRGANIQLYDANNTDAQRWKLNLVELVKDGDYNIVSKLSEEKVVDILGNRKGNGVNVQIYGKNGTSAQKWHISYDNKNGYYTIYNAGTNKVLDVNGASRINGANVQVWASNGTCAQKWIIEKIGDGYGISSACSGLMLDVSGANKIDGTNVQVYENNKTKAQRWVLR